MPNDIKRYSYTNFTNKPYIYHQGVACSNHANNNIENDRERTIIRTNQATNYVTRR